MSVYNYRKFALTGSVCYTDDVCSGYGLVAGESHPCNQSNKQTEFASPIWGSYQLIML